MLPSKSKVKHYSQVFLDTYTKEYSFIVKSKKGPNFAFCNVCGCDINIGHGGLSDIKVHVKSKKHGSMSNSLEKCTNIGSYFKNSTEDENAVINAECLFTAFIIEHNLPVAVADHAGPLFRRMFPKCETAKRYGSARTKTTAIIGEMAENFRSDLQNRMLDVPFSVATDGSNDSDSKLYPIIVTYYDSTVNEITQSLLSVPVLSCAATGLNIGNLLLSTLKSKGLQMKNCISFCADNAPVMMGLKSGVASMLLKENPELLLVGCTCHLINLAAEKGARTLPVAVDEILVDIFYYLQKSSKRKEKLKELQILYDVEVHKILKHVCTRWLSLGKSLRRLLEQWDPVLSFFKNEVKNNKLKMNDSLESYQIPLLKDSEKVRIRSSTGKTESPCSVIHPSKKRKIAVTKTKPVSDFLEPSKSLCREERLFMFLSSSINLAYCQFLDFIIPIFDSKNVILQSNGPKVHILKPLLLELLTALLTKFVKPNIIKGSSNLLGVLYSDKGNQKEDADIAIGNAALKIVNQLKEPERSSFYACIRKYYTASCDYIIHKFPLKSEFLDHAQVADIMNIDQKKFSDVLYFINKFPVMLPFQNDIDDEIDKLQFEFCDFQVDKLTENVLNQSRIDHQWAFVGGIKDAHGTLKYKRLSKVMLSILSIPHSNAECERMFSQVRKTRTEFRGSLSDSNLENLLVVKSNQRGCCYEQKYEDTFLKKAKSATYNGKINNINVKK